MSLPPGAGLPVMTHTLDVPGAHLYYERRGSGPLLLLIGSPMDSTGFTGLADAMADRYTVVTYDPRGIGYSTREDTSSEVTPEQQADDVRRLLAELGRGPARLFGSSGGAVVGLALVTAHPEEVTTLVAHEPPVIELLPDRDQVRAQMQDIYDTYRAEGAEQAMAKFMVHAGLDQGPGQAGRSPSWNPAPEQLARMRAATEAFLASMIRATTRFQPDLGALRAAPARIVIGVGATSAGQLANRSAVALAGQLGLPAVEFPGDHGGFVGQPEPFARALSRVLTEAT
jgi:clorobiocin biosynthesis protein CloN7